MAEWLRTGLQIRLRRFDSGSGLHYAVSGRQRTITFGRWSELLLGEAR